MRHVLRLRSSSPRAALLVALLLGAGMTAAAPALPAAADDVATVSSTARSTWGTDGTVYATARIGDLVVLGGKFTTLRDPATGASLPATNLAALDARTGQPVRGWAPPVNNTVHQLVAAPDGSRLYLGGEFTDVGGKRRARLAALGGDGALQAWTPGTNWTVRALALSGDRLYVGGDFASVTSGQSRTRLAAFSTTTGAVDPVWVPSADERVRSLLVSPDGTRVYVGGHFANVNGRSAPGVVALSPVNGSLDTTFVTRFTTDNDGFDLAADAERLYVAVGGKFNLLVGLRAADGAELWRDRADGDFQTVAVDGATVYGGGHFSDSVVDRPNGVSRVNPRKRLVAVHARDGLVVQGWAPELTPVFSPYFYGAWDLLVTREGLYAAGSFTHAAGAPQPSFAAFPAAVAPLAAPTSLGGAVVNGTTHVDLTWTASGAATGYAVERSADGLAWSAVGTTTATSWRDETSPGGSTSSYRVVALDGDRRSDPSSAVTVTALPAAPADLTAAPASGTDAAVDLQWVAAATAAGYDVERASAGQPYTALASGTAATSYRDTGLTPGTAYTYRVRSVRADGVGPWSAPVSATATSSELPATPSDLTAAATPATWWSIDLAWSPSARAASYAVERSSDGGATWTPLATTSSTTWQDKDGLMAGRTYAYRVAASNAAGASPWSAPVSGTTNIRTPNKVTGLAAAAAAPTVVDLRWDPSARAAAYVVERADDGKTFAQVGTATATSFTDTTVSGGTRYVYRVRATNDTGSGAASDPVAVTTPTG